MEERGREERRGEGREERGNPGEEGGEGRAASLHPLEFSKVGAYERNHQCRLQNDDFTYLLTYTRDCKQN